MARFTRIAPNVASDDRRETWDSASTISGPTTAARRGVVDAREGHRVAARGTPRSWGIGCELQIYVNGKFVSGKRLRNPRARNARSGCVAGCAPRWSGSSPQSIKLGTHDRFRIAWQDFPNY